MVDADEHNTIDRLSAVSSAGGSQCRATTSSGMSSELTAEDRDWSYSRGREHGHSPDNKKHESKFVNVEMNLPASIGARTTDADTYDCLGRRDDDDECDLGEVALRHSMYSQSFRITGGRLSARAVDEVYCLTDVMLGCRIHLSPFSPEEKYARESAGQDIP